jgi:hypothetical protein
LASDSAREPFRDLQRVRILEAQAADGQLEAVLHPGVVVVQVAREAAVLELNAVRVLEVDGLGPIVVDHVRHIDALGKELVALLREPGFRARLEGEVIEDARHAEATVDSRIVVRRHARDAARLHEGDELIVPGIEEDVADLPALRDLDDVAAHRLEPEDGFIEVAGRVEVQRGEAEVRKAFVGHGILLLRVRRCYHGDHELAIAATAAHQRLR